VKTALRNKKKQPQGSILVYLILLLVLAVAIASVGTYVSGTTAVAHRRSDMAAAQQYVEGGAVIACNDLNAAVMASGVNLASNLMNSSSSPYTKNTTLSTSQTNVYQRTITSPFTNQTITAQIWLPNVSSPQNAQISTSATVGSVTQTATVNINIFFAYGAAIISSNDGTTETGVAKPVAKDGNVVVNGNGDGPLVVYGGTGLGILCNGRANIATNFVNVPPSAISMTNYNTANQVPDYTAQGTNNTLFDFNRFIACANATPNLLNTNTHNNHFTNVLSFANAMSAATNHTLEGVIVVDINSTDGNWNKAGDSSLFPNGINIHGTLFYNFGAGFTPTTSFVVNTPLNINATNLSGVVASNPATYATGYPPLYTDPTKNPTNIIIAPAYQNFTAGEDLPALMYSIGEVDIHWPANVCGVCYTPSYMEIENMNDGQTQYFRGALIMGDGIYLENNHTGTTIVSYDVNTIKSLATAGSAGKQVMVSYWQ